MRYISYSKIDSMSILNYKYPNIRIFDRTRLLKVISKEELFSALKYKGKRVDKVVLPSVKDKLFKILFREEYAYTEEWIQDFSYITSFSSYEYQFSDQDILKFYRNLLFTLSSMHQEQVYSGDIWYENILINQDLDYRFIDFSLKIDPIFLDFYDSAYLFSHFSFSDQLQISDKMSLLSMILFSMLHMYFLPRRDSYIMTEEELQLFDFPYSIEQKFIDLFQHKKVPDGDDCFLEELDTLIKIDYKLPYRKNRYYRSTY